MTYEQLEKGTRLAKDIRRTEEKLAAIRTHKDIKTESSFSNGYYSISIPSAITEKVEMLIEIEFSTILEQKRKEFAELDVTVG